MSLSRRAYRHVASSSPLANDHVWVSEDFLATTFRRFANGRKQQQRYESRAPGPLESRRRLAKRRNTSLASVAGPGQWGDIACLFGRNGKEHMKWTDRRTQMQDRGEKRSDLGFSVAQVNGRGASRLMNTIHTTDTQSYLFSPPDVPSFYNKNNGELAGFPDGIENGKDMREKLVEEHLESNWSPTAIEEIVSRLNINLQQEPEYSRKICDHLLAKSVHGKDAAEALCLFLDDMTLNIRGSGNYAATVEHLAWHQTHPKSRLNCLRTVVRALKAGLVLPDELRVILKTIPRIKTDDDTEKQSHSRKVLDWYQSIWDAIGHCDVFGHTDLDTKTIDTWLGLLERQPSLEAFDLAKDIILATQTSCDPSWIPVCITRWLSLATKTNVKSENYVFELLQHLKPDVAANYIADITEALASLERGNGRTSLLAKWHNCLSAFLDTKYLVQSPAWSKMNFSKTISPSRVGLEEAGVLPESHRIILRLWALRTLSKPLPEGSLWQRREKMGDLPVLQLFDYYEAVRTENQTKQEKTIRKRRKGFLLSIMKVVQDLNLPFNGLLLAAVDAKIRKNASIGRQKALQQLESRPMHFAEIFAELDTYNSLKPILYSEFEKMIRRVNVTSRTFIDRSTHLAATGDTHGTWTIMRLLHHHIPLKIALSQSWHSDESDRHRKASRIQDTQQKSLSPPENAENNGLLATSKRVPLPDPHKALDMIHNLAVAFASSKNISSRRSFHLVHSLYVFLKDHNAPIRPSLVRAMYHAGVVRYQRDGNPVAQAKYVYIMELVKEFEDPQVAEELLRGPRYGESNLEKSNIEF